ncbi:MAG: hypothetical protein HRU76_15475 [Phycisphaeraceae bacterium]|nr:hypothetical protein [Phycisphaerales bacterium]QOJ18902.1 MAG: hypothetical protein HRU76_15475 [Phycisphaeraceae bacterium]
MEHSTAWQVLEERIDDDWSPSGGTVDRHVQHVWGGAVRGYIDDIILHREDGNVDGDYNDSFDSTWYHLTDPQFSTVAILDLSGAVIERVSYDAWGEPRHHPKHDFDGDGDFDQDDAEALDDLIVSGGGSVPITNAKYRAEMDIDRDGEVDSTDQTLRGVGGRWPLRGRAPLTRHRAR